MEPLRWSDELVQKERSLERVLRWVPLVGWAVCAWVLEPRRFRRFDAYVERTLASRERPDPLLWGSDGRRQEVARVVCSTLQEEMGLPNDYLLPADSLDVLFQADSDALGYLEVIMTLETRFGVSIRDGLFDPGCGKTLGQFVDYILSGNGTGEQSV